MKTQKIQGLSSNSNPCFFIKEVIKSHNDIALLSPFKSITKYTHLLFLTKILLQTNLSYFSLPFWRIEHNICWIHKLRDCHLVFFHLIFSTQMAEQNEKR